MRRRVSFSYSQSCASYFQVFDVLTNEDSDLDHCHCNVDLQDRPIQKSCLDVSLLDSRSSLVLASKSIDSSLDSNQIWNLGDQNHIYIISYRPIGQALFLLLLLIKITEITVLYCIINYYQSRSILYIYLSISYLESRPSNLSSSYRFHSLQTLGQVGLESRIQIQTLSVHYWLVS